MSRNFTEDKARVLYDLQRLQRGPIIDANPDVAPIKNTTFGELFISFRYPGDEGYVAPVTSRGILPVFITFADDPSLEIKSSFGRLHDQINGLKAPEDLEKLTAGLREGAEAVKEMDSFIGELK